MAAHQTRPDHRRMCVFILHCLRVCVSVPFAVAPPSSTVCVCVLAFVCEFACARFQNPIPEQLFGARTHTQDVCAHLTLSNS